MKYLEITNIYSILKKRFEWLRLIQKLDQFITENKSESKQAHICLTFVVYKVYKEIERQLEEKKSDLSPEKVIEILQSIYQIENITQTTKEKIVKTLLLTSEHKLLDELFEFRC